MEDGTVLAATDDGVATWRRGDDNWSVVRTSLEGREITSIAARPGQVVVGTKDGVLRSEDGGRAWEDASAGLTTRYVRWLAYDPSIPGRLFAGTEPAGIFVSDDGGSRWSARPEVERLRDRFHWFLPYSPEAGCVRGFAFHGDRAYAAVEVGGVLRSDDAGAAWRLAAGSTGEPDFTVPPEPLVHPDVHSVVTHACSPDLVLAVTAEGLYHSFDGGQTWKASHAGAYCRAAWVDPDDAKHILLGPADSVAHKHGRIEESLDGGQSWHDASNGLDLPWPDTMVERFVQADGELFAVSSDGRVYVTALSSISWRRLFADLGGVNCVAVFC